MPMTIVEPEYYSHFACLMADCKRNCCHGWRIHMSKKDYDKLRSKRLPAPMRERIRQGTKRFDHAEEGQPYAYIKVGEKESCPFLEEGLCAIQRNVGEEYLTYTCRVYPRKEVRMGDAMLNNTHNSCEATLYHLLESQQGLVFRTRAATPSELREFEKRQDYLEDHPMQPYSEQVRLVVLGIMQNRAYSLPDRLLLLGMAVRELDAIVAENRPQDTVEWMRKNAAMASGNTFAPQLEGLPSQIETGINNSILNLSIMGLQEELFPRLGMRMTEQVGKDGGRNFQIQRDNVFLKKAAAHLGSLLADHPLFIENLLVNDMLDLVFPWNIHFARQPYESYLSFCTAYTVYLFTMVAFAGEEGSMADVMDGLAWAARRLAHNSDAQKALVAHMKDMNTASLAQIAYLVRLDFGGL